MSLLARLNPFKTKAAEGSVRPGPYYIEGPGGGWLSAAAGQFMNWWQMGTSLQPYGQSGAMVEACVSAYAQTVAMCPGDHWKSLDNGGRERVTTSALSRLIRRPNDYQSMSDLLLNLTRKLYTKGEAFALAIRNNKNEIVELHWMRDGFPLVAADGSIFYQLTGNEIVDQRFDFNYPIPARDVLHIRLHTPRHPLKGESPILAAALDMMLSGAALNQQVAFYVNQARPSFMLETEEKLTAEQTRDLRARWDEQTKGENAGGTPILTWGLKAKPVSIAAGDAKLAEILKLSDQNVALAFRMPLQILGIGGTPFASTEALMSSWKAMGLGFALNHIEEAFGLLFGLKGFPEEYIEFDTNALLRSSFKEMIDALSNGTRRVMTPNEGRRYLDLPAKDGGDQLFVQMQDIPLSMAGKSAAPAPAVKPDETNADDDADVESEDTGKALAAFRASHAKSIAA